MGSAFLIDGTRPLERVDRAIILSRYALREQDFGALENINVHQWPSVCHLYLILKGLVLALDLDILLKNLQVLPLSINAVLQAIVR